MEKDIVDGQISDVGAYDIEFKGGKLVAKLDMNFGGGMAVAGVHVEIDAGKVLDKIAEKIPGKIDDALLGVMKAALLA